MKYLAIVIAMIGMSAQAFDLAVWRAQRDLHVREAERLRTAYSNCLQHIEHPAEDVMVPVETHTNGAVRLVVQARRAQIFLDTGLVWGEGITVEQYDDTHDRITIFSTHLLDVAVDLCDEIVLLHNGRLEPIDKNNLGDNDFKNKIIEALKDENDVQG